MQHRELTEQILGCAMKVHGQLGAGFLESVYQNALIHELKKAHIEVEAGRRILVRYDGVVVGEFVADLVVQDAVIIELKAVLNLLPVHEAQLVNYLVATGLDVGLLLNFGAARLEFKRKTREYRKKSPLDEFSL